MTPTVGVGTLNRLSGLQTGGRSVLSVYLALGSSRRVQIESETKTLIRDVRSTAGARAVALVEEELARRVPQLAYSSRGVAMFATVDRSVLEVVPLPARTQTVAVLDTIPWLEPLMAMCCPGNGDIGNIGAGLPVRTPASPMQAARFTSRPFTSRPSSRPYRGRVPMTADLAHR